MKNATLVIVILFCVVAVGLTGCPQMQTLNDNQIGIAKKLKAVGEDVTANRTDITTLKGDVAAIKGDVAATRAIVTGDGEVLDILRGLKATSRTPDSQSTTATNPLEPRLTELTNRVNAVVEDNQYLHNGLDDANSRLTTVENDVTDLKALYDRLQKLEDKQQAIMNRLDAVANSTASNTAAIASQMASAMRQFRDVWAELEKLKAQAPNDPQVSAAIRKLEERVGVLETAKAEVVPPPAPASVPSAAKPPVETPAAVRGAAVIETWGNAFYAPPTGCPDGSCGPPPPPVRRRGIPILPRRGNVLSRAEHL